jgi:hypothetical protein
MEFVIYTLLGLLLIAGIYYLLRSNQKSKSPKEEKPASAPASDCCGAHEVCEFDLLKLDETRIEYYDDEELDAYINIDEDKYTDQQIDEFREVLFTLKNHEIRYWLLSLERRKINLPLNLREEARFLMAEA